jgi:hypothetical protein
MERPGGGLKRDLARFLDVGLGRTGDEHAQVLQKLPTLIPGPKRRGHTCSTRSGCSDRLVGGVRHTWGAAAIGRLAEMLRVETDFGL